jgi:hypothetical protein
VARIAAATLDNVMHGVRARRGALLVEGELLGLRGFEPGDFAHWQRSWQPAVPPGIDCDKGDTAFPVRVPLEAEGHGRIGWLLLGPRPDGSLYGKDEREVLAEIADPVARAIRVVALRAAHEAETRDLLADIGARLTRIEQDRTERPLRP